MAFAASFRGSQATVQLNKEYYKSSACIPAFVVLLATSDNPTVGHFQRLTWKKKIIASQVRQLSAVELRKRVEHKSGFLWTSLDKLQRDEIKAKLPEVIVAEPQFVVFEIISVHVVHFSFRKLVRHSSARVVAAIAAIEFQDGTWPELLPFLHRSCTSSNVSHREVGSYILFTVLENIVAGFQEHLDNLFKLFEQLLHDPESEEVQIVTVRLVDTFRTHFPGH